jgi:hypothetical protein
LAGITPTTPAAAKTANTNLKNPVAETISTSKFRALITRAF